MHQHRHRNHTLLVQNVDRNMIYNIFHQLVQPLDKKYPKKKMIKTW